MRKYVCFFKHKQIVIEADSIYAAQCMAQTVFRAKKRWDVKVVPAEVPVSAASL